MKEKGGDIRTPGFSFSECKVKVFFLEKGDKGEILTSDGIAGNGGSFSYS